MSHARGLVVEAMVTEAGKVKMLWICDQVNLQRPGGPLATEAFRSVFIEIQRYDRRIDLLIGNLGYRWKG